MERGEGKENKEKDEEGVSEGRILKGWERMRVHTGKDVFLGSEGGDEGILLFLGRARWESWLRDWFGSRRSGDREILINWEKKRFQN